MSHLEKLGCYSGDTWPSWQWMVNRGGLVIDWEENLPALEY